MILVLTTVPNRSVATKIANLLVRQRLAACVTSLPKASSIYRWKNKIEKATEYLLLIKSTERAFSKLKQAIQARHPYEVPEIIAFKVEGSLKCYAEWLNACVDIH